MPKKINEPDNIKNMEKQQPSKKPIFWKIEKLLEDKTLVCNATDAKSHNFIVNVAISEIFKILKIS